jgi:hypothetical protein
MIIERGVRFSLPRRIPEPPAPPPVVSPLVVERDDGRWATGVHDDGPGFESRAFASAVAARQAVVSA